MQLFLFGLLVAGLFAVQNSSALTVTATTSDNGYAAHLVQWTDSAGLPRSAMMVDQTSTPPYTGFLRQYTYQVDGSPRVCTGTDNYAEGGDLEFSGDGFVQNHTASSGDFSSGNGAGVTGTTTITLQGTDHAIITYSMPTYEIDGPYYNPVNHRTIPTTVQWFFADGRDHPIFAISQDATQGGGNLGADSRSPYGDIAYDGDGTDSFVGGCSYGDTYQFITLAADEVTTNSGWDYTAANTIPYAMQWADPLTANAEFGHVATLPILISDAGQDSQYFNGSATTSESFYEDNRNTDSVSATTGPMINDQTWAYQIFSQNPIWPPGEPDTGIQSHRVTWGANWGRVGGFDGFDYGGSGTPDNEITNYTEHSTDPVGNPTENEYKGSGNPADGTLMAYSVFVVLGLHNGSYADGAVAQQVTQMQNVTHATLSTAIGTVKTSGPAGVGNATNRTITYSPAGFNPTYATWEVEATTNTANVTLTPGSSSYPLDQPVFVVNGYTSAQLPASISVNGSTAGDNYFASVDTNGHRLWITVNRAVSSALNLIVTAPAGGALAPVISSFAPTSGMAGTSINIAGANFTDVTAVAFNGLDSTNFTVDSATNISAEVPVGATSGTITVTTPGGTAISSTSFEIAGLTYSITVNALPTDGGSVLGGGTNFQAGSSQLVTATAYSGFVFTDWGGDASGTINPLTVKVNSNLNITANFAANPSATNITLTLVTNLPAYGTVTVSPKPVDGVLKQGHSYTLTATTDKGDVFVNWTGSINANKTPLTFKAESNMVLQANFIPNPFMRYVGTYNGLFWADNGIVAEESAGMLKGLALTSKGTYSGSLLIDGVSKSVSGTFDLTGVASNKSISLGGQKGDVHLVMTLTSNGPAPRVTGTVSNAAGTWVASNLIAYRATNNSVISNQYTMLIPPDINEPSPPGGYGYALITATQGNAKTAASAKISGALADGTAFSQTVPVSLEGYIPIYASLYSGKGLLLGRINLTNASADVLYWVLQGHGLFQSGSSTNQILLSTWTDSPSTNGLTNLVVVTTTGTPAISTNYPITISSKTYAFGKSPGPAPYGSIAPKTGLLKVTFGSGASKGTGYGVILLDATNGTNGGGYFLNKTSAGSILLAP